MKILIIDDEKGVTDIYREKFSAGGDTVSIANNGDEGLKKAAKEQPDLILLDIIMPKMNGLDVLKNLKSEENTRSIPVILLTNLPSEMSAEKAKKLGATEYLVKAEYDPDHVVDIAKKSLPKT